MQYDTIITYSLDLLIRVIDTTSGAEIDDNDLYVEKDGQDVSYKSKGNGNLILINTGRENFELKIKLRGYHEKIVKIDYQELDEALPSVELHLIPDAFYQTSIPCHSYSDRVDGLLSVDAVRLGEGACQIKEYDVRRKIMEIYNPHHVEMKHVFYAVVNTESKDYEVFEIDKYISDVSYKTKKKLEKEFANHYPISRVVFGSVNSEGVFFIKVRNDRKDAKWIVRFTFNEDVKFAVLDFNAPKPINELLLETQ